jgi:poly(A) polymerase
MRLRASTGEIDTSLADWWEDFQHASDDERDEMIEAQRRQPSPKGGARRASATKTRDDEADDSTEPNADERVDSEADAPAKKRRRRRRKPGAGGDAPAAAE